MNFFERNYASKMADRIYQYAKKMLKYKNIDTKSLLEIDGNFGIFYINHNETVEHNFKFLGERSPDFVVYDEDINPVINMFIIGKTLCGIYRVGIEGQEEILPAENISEEESRFFLNVLHIKQDLEGKTDSNLLQMNLTIFESDYVDYISKWKLELQENSKTNKINISSDNSLK